MSDLFGSDSLFIDFEKQVVNEEKGFVGKSLENAKTKLTDKKSASVFKLRDYGCMKIPANSPFVSSLAALDDRPNYTSTFRDPLMPPVKSDDDPNKPARKPTKPKLSCFNCGGAHMLTACQQPKDFGRISQKRREYNEANPLSNRHNATQPGVASANGSYTPDTPQLPELVSFDHFRPGNISTVLRHALGLYPNQIPPYVYILRVLGYPPGWLEEARVPLASGEVSDVPLFDPKLIVEYPGFNASLPAEAADESRQFGVPRMDLKHSAKEMRRWMEALKEHRNHLQSLKKSDSTSQKHSSSSNHMHHHHKTNSSVSGGEMAMDLEDTSDNEPDFVAPNTVTDLPLNEDSSSRGSEGIADVEGADVESLEQEREKLLRLLESTLSGNNAQPEDQEHDSSASGDDIIAETKGVTTPVTDQKLCASQSLGVSSGTPLPEATGAPNSVPCREKFASGIGIHLPFQNLEGSVGTFERLQRVLAGIRNRQSGAGPSTTSGSGFASLPSSPQTLSLKSTRDGSGNANRNSSRSGYVDYDSPAGIAESPRLHEGRDKRIPSRQTHDHVVQHHMAHYHSQASSSRGYWSEPRTSHSNRHRPY